MNLAERIAKIYFDLVYVAVYDVTTGKLICYQNIQDKTIAKLEIEKGNNVLCVGVGTGNEVERILRNNHVSNVFGIDYSAPSINKAIDKLMPYTDKVQLAVGDAHNLEFKNNTFDRVLCVCVMGFVSDRHRVISEIVRVLKPNGRFAVTYPGKKGKPVGVLRGQIKDEIKKQKPLHFVFSFILGLLLYAPLIFQRTHHPEKKEDILSDLKQLGVKDISIEVDPVYYDYIVSGVKE